MTTRVRTPEERLQQLIREFKRTKRRPLTSEADHKRATLDLYRIENAIRKLEVMIHDETRTPFNPETD